MDDVEDELWRNVMSWWAGIPVTGHVRMPVERGIGFLLQKSIKSVHCVVFLIKA